MRCGCDAIQPLGKQIASCCLDSAASVPVVGTENGYGGSPKTLLQEKVGGEEQKEQTRMAAASRYATQGTKSNRSEDGRAHGVTLVHLLVQD